MGMTLWLLRPVEGLPDDDNPWRWPYDKVHGFVVLGESEEAARAFAAASAGDEMSGLSDGAGKWTVHNPWLDCQLTTCVELSDEPAGVIMRDFVAG